MRRQLIPVGVAIGVGLIVLLHLLVKIDYLDGVAAVLIGWAALIAAFAVLLGLFNVVAVHLQRVARRDGNSWSSLVILITALVVFLLVLPSGGASAASRWVLTYFYQPLEATFLALIVFFIATAAFRAWRVPSWQNALMIVATLIVLIGSAPIANLISPLLPAAKEWVMSVPTVAGVRGILIGVGLGVIATSLRLLTGIDRPYSE